MKALAEYAMRGRMQATAISSLFAVLSLILPPLSYISGAVVALVTMRQGVSQGAFVAFVAVLVLAVISMVSTGNIIVAVVFGVVVWLPVWLLAIVLRQTVSLPITLAVATLICCVAVFAFHLSIGNTVEWWQNVLDKVLAEVFTQPGVNAADVEMMRTTASQYMTGLMASAFFISMVLSVFLARWWQAILYNPGGFKLEFLQFRVERSIAILGALIMIWAMLTPVPGSLASDLSVVISIYASVAGIALIHHWVAATEAHKAWIILLYLLLFFIAPQILVLLAIIGFADAWLNIRRYYENKAT